MLFQYISHRITNEVRDVECVTVYGGFLLFISCYVVTLWFIVSYNIYLSRLDFQEETSQAMETPRKRFFHVAVLCCAEIFKIWIIFLRCLVLTPCREIRCKKVLLDFIAFFLLQIYVFCFFRGYFCLRHNKQHCWSFWTHSETLSNNVEADQALVIEISNARFSVSQYSSLINTPINAEFHYDFFSIAISTREME